MVFLRGWGWGLSKGPVSNFLEPRLVACRFQALLLVPCCVDLTYPKIKAVHRQQVWSHSGVGSIVEGSVSGTVVCCVWYGFIWFGHCLFSQVRILAVCVQKELHDTLFPCDDHGQKRKQIITQHKMS